MSYRGTKLSEESKRKIGLSNSIALKGRQVSQEVKDKISKSHKGKKLSKEHINKLSGKNSINWRGNNICYYTKHQWVEKEKGKPKYCEKCKSTKKKKYEWANIDHKYRRILKDYIRLCTSCHRKYDYENHLSNIGSRGGSIKNNQIEFTPQGLVPVVD